MIFGYCQFLTRLLQWLPILLPNLKMVHSLFNELKERYVIMLSDTLPYVSELLEDMNEKVNKESYKVIKFIEKSTGENLDTYI